MFKGILILCLLSFCNSCNIKKQVCINCKLNVLRHNKKSNIIYPSYCRTSDCIYRKKINLFTLIEPNPVDYHVIEPNAKEQEQEEKVVESLIETEIDKEIKKLCENCDNLIERIKIYKKAKVKKFIKKLYDSVNEKLDEYD
jgi:hypothetical protein